MQSDIFVSVLILCLGQHFYSVYFPFSSKTDETVPGGGNEFPVFVVIIIVLIIIIVVLCCVVYWVRKHMVSNIRQISPNRINFTQNLIGYDENALNESRLSLCDLPSVIAIDLHSI